MPYQVPGRGVLPFWVIQGDAWPEWVCFRGQKSADGCNGTVNVIQWMKIALLFLHFMSKLFQFMILNLSG